MSYVQVYTGDGKGKTTAAIGLCVRAIGAGQRVLFMQFMKECNYSEHSVLPAISETITLESVGKPYFIARIEDIPPEILASYGDGCVVFERGNPPADYVEKVVGGLRRAACAIESGEYDLVILDEINCAIFFELLDVDDVLAALDRRSSNTEVVLTGRGAPQALIDYADLVTEMREIKHYYNIGVQARRGIEN